MSSNTPESNPAATGRRNRPYARVWTARAEPLLPVDLADRLYARGFMPGLVDTNGKAYTESGLADAQFTVGGDGWRFISISSARGEGCLVSVRAADASDLPDDYLARRAVPRPKLVYWIEAGGPSNSDRNLCEAIAESLLLATDGVVQIGGLGVKGNRPVLHTRSWLGAIKNYD